MGAYFGRGMEFSTSLEPSNIDQAHTDSSGCRLIKAHEWAYKLNEIKQQYPRDWIILVYRPDLLSFAWWNGAGGFNISYPKYDQFKDAITMMNEISQTEDFSQFSCFFQLNLLVINAKVDFHHHIYQDIV